MQNTPSIIADCLKYLKKQTKFVRRIDSLPLRHIDFIVVIPSKGEDQLERALRSLTQTQREDISIEVIVVINRSEDEAGSLTDQINCDSVAVCQKYSREYETDDFQIHSIDIIFPSKEAGVGLARKTGMDEAVSRFLEVSNLNGCIVNFDADCTCDRNFFVALKLKFEDTTIDAVSIYVEHDIEEYPENVAYITAYECHLRYYIMAQRYTGHPFIHHTVGSAMATTCYSYCRFGGMNTRKAGEDFYYLNKIAKYGNVCDLLTTGIVASSRNSDRVPFGTGRSMHLASRDNKIPMTYSFQSFKLLKQIFDKTLNGENPSKDYKRIVSKPLNEFITEMAWEKALTEISENTNTPQQFRRRFFQWFDAFKIMKACNYLRASHFGEISVNQALTDLFKELNNYPGELDSHGWLIFCRDVEKGSKISNPL